MLKLLKTNFILAFEHLSVQMQELKIKELALKVNVAMNRTATKKKTAVFQFCTKSKTKSNFFNL